jgi:hypothetical protein
VRCDGEQKKEGWLTQSTILAAVMATSAFWMMRRTVFFVGDFDMGLT